MTEEEKLAKQNAVKADFAAKRTNCKTWIFNEETCEFDPPVPMPTDDPDAIYHWRHSTQSWVKQPPKPDDGKLYSFRLKLEKWDEVDSLTNRFISDGVKTGP
jgi:hypothetical protein